MGLHLLWFMLGFSAGSQSCALGMKYVLSRRSVKCIPVCFWFLTSARCMLADDFK